MYVVALVFGDTLMQITKTVLENWQIGHPKKLQKTTTDNTIDRYVGRLMKQCKKISQIIARSWMEDEQAYQLRDYFINPGNEDAPDGRLKELFGNKDGLLLKIFPNYKEPVFDEYELREVYSFYVSWDIWEGSINEIAKPSTEQGKYYFNVVIPYPPRPQLCKSTVTMEQLDSWVKQAVTDENGNILIDKDHQIYPPYPYIPPSTC
jgi:hypothetical protein